MVYAYSDLGRPSGTYVVANAVQLGNGDGRPDLLLLDGSLQATGDSSGTYVNYNFGVTVGGATLVYDMNGDGRPDILATSTQLFGQAAPSGSGAAATPDFALTASVAAGTVSPGAAATTTACRAPARGCCARRACRTMRVGRLRPRRSRRPGLGDRCRLDGGAPTTGGGTPGTAAGTYTIKITATAGTTVQNVTYTLTVN